MQDFDTLRNRVEETAQKLTSAQGERQEQTETLVGILRQLEEKYAAQEQQVSYYRDRVEPLEQANEQLSLLMGTLLDLIDDGFGDDSLAPMRKASEMATAMLATDLAPAAEEPVEEPIEELMEERAEDMAPSMVPDNEPPVADAPAMAETGDPEFVTEAEMEITVEPEPEPELDVAAETEFDAELEAEPSTEPATEPSAEFTAEPSAESAGLTPDEVLDLIETDTDVPEPAAEFAPEEPGAAEEEIAGPASVVTDFEMEEEALARLEEDIDPAVEEMPAPLEMLDDAPVAAVEEPSLDDAITIDEIVGDGEMAEIAEMAEAQPAEDAAFEDVSAATLELEQEEDVAAGLDDLPNVVQLAVAAAQTPDGEAETIDAVATDEAVAVMAETGDAGLEMAEDLDVESASDEAEAIAAIAKAIEDEANAENPRPPEPADIRTLLLRVEALAKKAEAMRMTQEAPAESEQALQSDDGPETEDSGGDEQKQAGAAA